MSQTETTPETPAPLPSRPRRRWGRMLLRFFLLIAIPAAALYGGAYWYEVTGRYVSTENAYVKAHVVAISTDIDGRVVSVHVKENQHITKGTLLFRLDPNPYWVKIKMAEAKRDAVRYEIEATRAEFRQIQAQIAEAVGNAGYYERELGRQRQLAERAVATRAKLDEAEFNYNASLQKVKALRERVRQVLAKLGGDPDRSADLHPLFLEAEAEIEDARLKLGYTEVRAPEDGVVTRVKLEPGEWLEAGSPAFGLIATGLVWIEANLKETQLTNVREQQAVTIEVDAYPDVVWQAKVSSISPATGAEFAVLPPQNASGNWVKVVQRLPGRIEIEPRPDQPPLRAGMTATVSIDTKHQRKLMTTVKEALAKLTDSGAKPAEEAK